MADPAYPSNYDQPDLAPSVTTMPQDQQNPPPSRTPQRSSNTAASGSVFDMLKSYVLSLYGLLKITEIVLCLFGIIFAGASDRHIAARGFFIFIELLFMISTTALVIIYGLQFHHKLDSFPWPLFELVFNALAIALIGLSSIILAALCNGNGLLIMAAIVGFISLLVYCATGFFGFIEFRSGGDPAGPAAA